MHRSHHILRKNSVTNVMCPSGLKNFSWKATGFLCHRQNLAIHSWEALLCPFPTVCRYEMTVSPVMPVRPQ